MGPMRLQPSPPQTGWGNIMTRHRRRVTACALTAALSGLATLSLSTAAEAQSAAYFSPTYAASDGSPYSSVYARTFGTGGPPVPATPAPAPLVTSAGPPASASAVEGDVVYVIEKGRLLTYRAADYARGGQALAGAAVPPAASGSAAATPQADLSSIADRLYGAPPLDTAAGPIQLVPPRKPDALGN